MSVITRAQTVDLGYGRGRLAPAPAASVRRIDAQLGRGADVNSAWRDPVLQDRMFAAWQAFLQGRGERPNHGRALPSSQSVHCKGEAVDSDDWGDPHAAAVWRDNGWRQTASDEWWHGEYFQHLDNHRNDTAGTDSKPLPTSPEPIEQKDTTMRLMYITDERDEQKRRVAVGELSYEVQGPEASARARILWGDPINVTKAEAAGFLADVNKRRAQNKLHPLKGVRGEV